jgi:DNA-binding FadR family transcriptional regulator
MTQPNLPLVAQGPERPAPDREGVRVTTFRGQPPARQRVADHVFDALARAILGGEIKPGEPVPTQRDLAQQFNVSALIVRQAIHRLEDLKLVRVRQGSATIVLDPNESSDIRLIQLRMELAEPGAALSLSAWENQLLFVVPMLALAERRITDQEIEDLRHLAKRIVETNEAADTQRLRFEFWALIATATRNPLFQQQVRWWSALASEKNVRGAAVRPPNVKRETGLYSGVIKALESREGAVQHYLDTIRPVLDFMDKARDKARNAPR